MAAMDSWRIAELPAHPVHASAEAAAQAEPLTLFWMIARKGKFARKVLVVFYPMLPALFPILPARPRI